MGNGKKPYNYNGNRKHNKNVKNNRNNISMVKYYMDT